MRRSGRNKKQRNCVSKKKESGGAVNSGRWRAVNWGERGATGCAESDGVRGGGWSGSDQTRRLAWVHSLYRMHPGVIYIYIVTYIIFVIDSFYI